MQYALLGDIHSSLDDLAVVLASIRKIAPHARLIGTGDLFECTVSKKNLHGQLYERVGEVIDNPEGFEELLAFPSVRGNQEERILLLTDNDEPLRRILDALPEMLDLPHGVVIHGHQWDWMKSPWSYVASQSQANIVFYGHTHDSALHLNGDKIDMEFQQRYSLNEEGLFAVNVGAVVGAREWVLYDAAERTVQFMKA